MCRNARIFFRAANAVLFPDKFFFFTCCYCLINVAILSLFSQDVNEVENGAKINVSFSAE